MEKTGYLNAFNKMPFVGAKRVNSLLKLIPDVEKAWYAPLNTLKQAEGWANLADKFVAERSKIRVEEEWEKVQKSGFNVIALDDPEYPRLLKEIHSPPILIYIDGELRDDEASLAIVGSRKSTLYGREIALKFARELVSHGITVVSGMALGIDTWAHNGALEAEGRTIAVLGSGVDVCYPAKNYELKKKIPQRGAVISEFPLGNTPVPQNFPQRNRIISGLTLGTIVVEAMERSGALITTDFALEQGREVFAVPGNINSPYSRGCNRLIKQGAKLVESVDDILEELELLINKTGAGQGKQMSLLDPEEERVLTQVPYQPVHADELIQLSGLSASKLSALMLSLELKGLVKQLSGKYFMRV